MKHLYDVVIIGGGPAGKSAAIYAARKKMDSLIISKNYTGASAIVSEINNFIGSKSINGYDLSIQMLDHLNTYKEDITRISLSVKLSNPLTVLNILK